MHEIAHYVVARPEQRDLPEYGLGYVAAAGENCCVGVVDHNESAIQEHMAQLLCVLWGERYGISPALPDLLPCMSWQQYLVFKISESIYHMDSPEYMWEAMIRVLEYQYS